MIMCIAIVHISMIIFVVIKSSLSYSFLKIFYWNNNQDAPHSVATVSQCQTPECCFLSNTKQCTWHQLHFSLTNSRSKKKFFYQVYWRQQIEPFVCRVIFHFIPPQVLVIYSIFVFQPSGWKTEFKIFFPTTRPTAQSMSCFWRYSCYCICSFSLLCLVFLNLFSNLDSVDLMLLSLMCTVMCYEEWWFSSCPPLILKAFYG